MSDPQTAPQSAPVGSFLVQNYRRQDVRFVRGQGCTLWDDRGRSFIDAFAGVAVSALGHAHPALVAAITQQAGQLLHVSNHYGIVQQEALAKRIVQAGFPGNVLFCNSGTEANECAYKVVRLWGNVAHGGRKTRMIAFEGGFHGRTLAALSITANPAYREPFAPMPATTFVPFGDIAALTAAMGDDVAGVFLEPVQGEGGVNTPPAGFLTAVRHLCDKHQAAMVVDEVQTGIGRSGKMYAWQLEGATPDIMTLAKGLGGGVPIGATVLAPAYAALLKPGLHGTTFGGNPLACAAATCVVDTVLAPGFLAHVAARGAQLRAGLAQVFPGQVVRGCGLLLGVQLDREPGDLVKAALEEGLVVGPSGNKTLRLAPPLIITAADIDEVCARLAKAKARL